MEIATLFVIAVILICPISMYWMMRRHRDHGSEGGGDSIAAPPESRRDKPGVDQDMFRK